MKKILSTALPMLLLLLVPAAPPHAAETAKPIITDPAKIPVARVNGTEITMYNLNIAVGTLLPMQVYHASVPEEKFKDLQRQALEQIINDELIYKAAMDAGEADVKDKEIDEDIKRLKKGLPKGETLDKVLKKSGMTIKDLKDDIRRSIAVRRYTEKKTEAVKKEAASIVTEAYLKDYYKKNLKKFKEPEQYHLRTMLVKADPSGGQKVWDESLRKAQDLSKRAKAGEDFSELAKKHSEDPYAKGGGDMGWTHKGSLFEEIDMAVEKLKVGGISEPVMTLYGYHVVKLEGKRPSIQKKYEEIKKDKLRKELEAKENARLREGWIKSLRDQAKIEYLSEIKPLKKK